MCKLWRQFLASAFLFSFFVSCVNKNVVNYSNDIIKISRYFDVEPSKVSMLNKRVVSELEIIKILFLSKASNKSVSDILSEREKKEWEEILTEYGIDKDNFENITERILSNLSVQ